MVKLPGYVKRAIEILEKGGFEAYAVGGCVRDSLLLKEPHDWDLCTSAEPCEICEAFKGYHVIETGLQHGTVTVRIEHKSIEITTFRSDGEYTDHRRPQNVQFVKSLKEDLSRRDFTINALCFSEKSGIVDLFGGREDLEKRVIRCVGEPEKRFDEDALRILRALRFASLLGFEIEEKTAQAIHGMKGLLKEISAERIREELLKLLCGRGVFAVLDKYRDVLAEIIPEIKEQFDFCQCNPHHCYDIYTHTLKTVENVKERADLRLVMLFHDIGKPRVFKLDENGVGHFKKHPSVSAEMANEILRRLKFDNKTREYVVAQIVEHDNRFLAERKSVRRFIAKYGYDFFYDHLEIRRADTLAQSGYNREGKLFDLNKKREIGDELISQKAELSKKDLKIDGRVLIEAGYPQGKALKVILEGCLEAVVDEKVENDRDELLKYAGENFGCLKEK